MLQTYYDVAQVRAISARALMYYVQIPTRITVQHV